MCFLWEDVGCKFLGEEESDEDEDEVDVELLGGGDHEEKEDPDDEEDADGFLDAESVFDVDELGFDGVDPCLMWWRWCFFG